MDHTIINIYDEKKDEYWPVIIDNDDVEDFKKYNWRIANNSIVTKSQNRKTISLFFYEKYGWHVYSNTKNKYDWTKKERGITESVLNIDDTNIWRIFKYRGVYYDDLKISIFGEIVNITNKIIYKKVKNRKSNGSQTYVISPLINGQQLNISYSRAMCENFDIVDERDKHEVIKTQKKIYCVEHIDGDDSNFSVSNLRIRNRTINKQIGHVYNFENIENNRVKVFIDDSYVIIDSNFVDEFKKHKWLKPNKSNYYFRCNTCGTTTPLHLMVYKYNYPEYDRSLCVDHLDNDIRNNSITNLEATTYEINGMNKQASKKHITVEMLQEYVNKGRGYYVLKRVCCRKIICNQSYRFSDYCTLEDCAATINKKIDELQSIYQKIREEKTISFIDTRIFSSISNIVAKNGFKYVQKLFKENGYQLDIA